MDNVIFTPDGFRDVYNDENEQSKRCIGIIDDVLKNYAYSSIDTPLMEYESLYKKAGTVKSENLFRFFDNDGKVLSLRADFTPSIARAASVMLKNDKSSLKIRYSGKVYRNDSALRGYLREFTQIGAEYIGQSDPSVDAEIIKTVCDCILALKIDGFIISISNSSIIKDIFSYTKLSEQETDKAESFIKNKNFFGLSEYLSGKNIPEDVINLFLLLEKDLIVRDELESIINSLSKDNKFIALKDDFSYLLSVYDLLINEGYDKYVSFDLGQINYMDYYTGIIFSGYAKGSGSSILRGGRYDNLLSVFGCQAGAIGFAFSLENLMAVISGQ